MLIQKTAKLEDVQNKGQRAVVVAILSKLNAPIALDALTKKCVATGKYNGKGTKGHVNAWAQAKAGGDEGSVRYHVNALAKEGRVKVTDGVAKPTKPARKPKGEPAQEVVTRQEAAEIAAEQAADIAEDAREVA